MSARSYLFVPGDQPEKLSRARERGADALLVDLEDAVAPSAKVGARRTVAQWLDGRGAGGVRPEVWVRVNPPPRLEADLAAVVQPGVVGICVPKVGSADDLRLLGDRLDELEPAAGLLPGSVRVMPLLESAAAVLDARAVAAAPRVAQVAIGEVDLQSELGLEPGHDERELLAARSHVVLASSAAGVGAPMGSVSTEFRDLDRFRRSTEALRRLGFGSRAAIHPAQVLVINEVFTPSEEEVAAAARLVEQHEAATREGTGAFVDDAGRMVDEAVVRSARRTLARGRSLDAGRR